MPLPVSPPAAAPDNAQGPAAPQKSVAHLVFDVALAISLVAALGAVYVFDRSSASDKPAVDEPRSWSRRQIPETKEPGPKLRLAVTKPLFDDMGKLLDMLGEGYQHETIALNELFRPTRFPSSTSSS